MEFQTYSFKVPKLAQFGNIEYDDAFKKFSEAMAQNDQTHVDAKKQLMLNQCCEQPINGLLSLKFDSDFESGNLDLAANTFRDRNDEYDLIMRLDSNSRIHQQWFYFSVDTANRGDYKSQKVRFNLLNFTKPYSLYQQGMMPLVWSEKLYESQGIGWHRGGSDIQYYRGRLKRVNYRNPCSQLSFEYQFAYTGDKVYFAYGLPYTFSMLNSFIQHVQEVQHQNEELSTIFK